MLNGTFTRRITVLPDIYKKEKPLPLGVVMGASV